MNDKWAIDKSAGRPILVYENCSVIEGEQAEFALCAIQSLTAANEKVAALEKRVKVLEFENNGLSEIMEALRIMVNRREAELVRLRPAAQQPTGEQTNG